MKPPLVPWRIRLRNPALSPQWLLLPLLALFSSTTLALDLTPFYGSQGGGDLNHIDSDSTLSLKTTSARGLILGWPISSYQDEELFYSEQQTRLQQGDVAVPPEDLITLEIRTLQLGGTVLSDEYHGLQGFLSGGLGITHYSPSLSGAAAETRPSLSLGLGARWMPTARVGLRLEGRLLGSLFNSDTTVFCSGGCSFSISGELLRQYVLFTGLVVRLD